VYQSVEMAVDWGIARRDLQGIKAYLLKEDFQQLW